MKLDAGLIVPATRLVQCAGKSVLLVEPFEIIPTIDHRHMVSFQTLLKAQGYFQMLYQDLLDIERKYSDNPAVFREMVFNGAIGTLVDHLKNFWMVLDRHQGWRLSPAFDLIPDVARRG